MDDGAETLTARLRDAVGDDLRAVARGQAVADDLEYEITYLREDVSDRYTTATYDRIFEELVAEYYRRGWEEDLFEPLGRLDHTVQVHDDGVSVVTWSDGGFLFVSVERTLDAIPQVIGVLDETG